MCWLRGTRPLPLSTQALHSASPTDSVHLVNAPMLLPEWGPRACICSRKAPWVAIILLVDITLGGAASEEGSSQVARKGPSVPIMVLSPGSFALWLPWGLTWALGVVESKTCGLSLWGSVGQVASQSESSSWSRISSASCTTCSFFISHLWLQILVVGGFVVLPLFSGSLGVFLGQE